MSRRGRPRPPATPPQARFPEVVVLPPRASTSRHAPLDSIDALVLISRDVAPVLALLQPGRDRALFTPAEALRRLARARELRRACPTAWATYARRHGGVVELDALLARAEHAARGRAA